MKKRLSNSTRVQVKKGWVRRKKYRAIPAAVSKLESVHKVHPHAAYLIFDRRCTMPAAL